MDAKQIVNAGGPVAVGPLTFVVRELTVEGEFGLGAKLRAEARTSLGPGGLMANVTPVARWLREQGLHADAAALVASTAPLVARKEGVGDDEATLYRQTPDGVACELFYRTRATHPEATREEIRAALNEANALEVHLQILEALAPGNSKTPSDSPTGS